jgi:class 3 adenylate cyclase
VKQHAAGGQVLVDSQSCAQVTNVSLRAVFFGSHHFKGMKESVDIYQMTQEVRLTAS